MTVRDEARAQNRLGQEAFNAQNYRQAIEHFSRSNQLSPDGGTLNAIAQSYFRLNDCQNALAYARQAEAAGHQFTANQRAIFEHCQTSTGAGSPVDVGKQANGAWPIVGDVGKSTSQVIGETYQAVEDGIKDALGIATDTGVVAPSDVSTTSSRIPLYIGIGAAALGAAGIAIYFATKGGN